MVNYSEIFEQKGISYETYRLLIDKLLAEGKTTGPDNSEAMLQYSKMNVQRMNRLDKTVVLDDSLVETVNNLTGSYKLLVITEGWCGDASQIVPIFDKLVKAAANKLELRFVLRDENLPLIDAHLTNGGRAVPVLLILNESANEVLLQWGPRPAEAQSLLLEWKKESSDMMVISEKLHGWYAKDKTHTTQAELKAVFAKLK